MKFHAFVWATSGFAAFAVYDTAFGAAAKPAPIAAPTATAPSSPPEGAKESPPTVEELAAFLRRANAELKTAWSLRERSAFVNQTYLTDDTDELAAHFDERALETQLRLIEGAKKFQSLRNSSTAIAAELLRQLSLLVLSTTIPAPADPKVRRELSENSARLGSMYGRGQACITNKNGAEKCYTQEEASHLMASSRDPQLLKSLWLKWYAVGVPMRPLFNREVEIINQAVRPLGFADVGELWRSGYDMPADDFQQETERLWAQVRPFYEQLHCYVRKRLSDRYGKDLVPPRGLIPAHLLGNLWAQEWNNIEPLVAPYGEVKVTNVTQALVAQHYDSRKMTKLAERFFVSLGFPPLPETFWTRSMFERPSGRNVVCHASADDITGDGDLRVKVCLSPTAEDFVTIHHELGHDFYFQQYRDQPALFQSGANDGFHEGIGDAIALSINDDYLRKVGLIGKAPLANGADKPQARKELINRQMASALSKVAFLPFGLLIDRWRWEVFAGKVAPDHYNQRWWELVQTYQGVAPAAPRSENDFDPGAKYHVPANVPYTRYFLARILQFQFHRALCKATGFAGPLYECSIFGKPEAGEKLRQMLALGASKPWPEALAKLTGEQSGEDRMDATAMLEYYAPLSAWLKEKNQGLSCGW